MEKKKKMLNEQERETSDPSILKMKGECSFFLLLYLVITKEEWIKATKGTVVKLQWKPYEVEKLELTDLASSS